MNGESSYVSVVEPLTPAIERVKTILFRPFDLGKWFVIGFCAWLAELGKPKGGGNGGGGGGGNGGPHFSFDGRPDLEEITERARDFFAEARMYVEQNMHWIVPVAIVGAVIMIIIWLLLMWLSSRGKFMFLHCVVENKGEVGVPWNKYERHANSLFVFRIVVGLINLVAVIVAVLAGMMLFAGAAMSGAGGVAVLGVVSVFVLMIALGIVLFLIRKFTTDFVVPIMFLRTTSCSTAWREFLAVLTVNSGRFILYVLFQIAIWIVVMFLIVALACVTCCCAACILGIPFIGTVLLLPILVFHRSYSLYYLRQYGPAFNVFDATEQVVSPS
ncbi:MAG: hypothetical protein JXM79_23075 [Sedimentisphaerales bacterium]|nr:hypothetical protein [Sedimentisphaerales bacterium]